MKAHLRDLSFLRLGFYAAVNGGNILAVGITMAMYNNLYCHLLYCYVNISLLFPIIFLFP